MVHDQELRGVYNSIEDAGQDAIEKYGKGPYLIHGIGIAPAVLPIAVFDRSEIEDSNC